MLLAQSRLRDRDGLVPSATLEGAGERCRGLHNGALLFDIRHRAVMICDINGVGKQSAQLVAFNSRLRCASTRATADIDVRAFPGLYLNQGIPMFTVASDNDRLGPVNKSMSGLQYTSPLPFNLACHPVGSEA